MNYCDKCFVDLDKEDHKSFCPKKKKKSDMPEGFEEIFGDLTKPKQ